jgi:hypothetical protein
MCGSWAWTLTATSPSGAAPALPRASVLVLVRRLCDVVVAFVYFWGFRMHFDGGRQLCIVVFFGRGWGIYLVLIPLMHTLEI